jgi:hypothetical protein
MDCTQVSMNCSRGFPWVIHKGFHGWFPRIVTWKRIEKPLVETYGNIWEPQETSRETNRGDRPIITCRDTQEESDGSTASDTDNEDEPEDSEQTTPQRH